MADRNEVFRIILEGRDKLSGQLGNVKKSVDELDKSLQKLKRNKPGEFPLFGGGKAVRGPGGQFINKEDVQNVNAMTAALGKLKTAYREAKYGRDTFQKGQVRQGPGGRFERIPSEQREFISSLREGIAIGNKTQALIEKKIASTKEQYNLQKLALEAEEQLARVELTAEQQRRRSQIREILIDMREADIEVINQKKDEIAALKERDDLNKEQQKEVKRVIEAEIRAIRDERKRRETLASERLTNRFAARRAGIGIEFNEARRQLGAPDFEEVTEEVREARREMLATSNAIAAIGKRIGLAIGDTVRGFRSARKEARDFRDGITLVNNVFTRLGQTIGQVFRNFGALVNLRWVFITSILGSLLTVLTQVAAALVAVAASAVQAGAALGGALAAGAAQAAPVVGLLAAAMSRFNTVLDAVKLNEKLNTETADRMDTIRQAAQRLDDAQYSLKRAYEAVGDAQYDALQANKDVAQALKEQRQAVEGLAEARRQAARDIVDANLEEKDAALALKEAELEVLDAKRKLREEEEKRRNRDSDIEGARAALREAQDRLRIAREQQDQSEISGAQQEVTIAEQNLSAIQDEAAKAKDEIKDAQLAVERANLTRDQAAIRDKRAREDAARARKLGVEGAEIVKNAQDQLKTATEGVAKAQRQVAISNRGIRDALRAVAVAQREVTDAQREAAKAQTDTDEATKKAREAYADLAPSEKKLYKALERIRKRFKEIFAGTSERDGILGPINAAMANFIDQLLKVMEDPRVQRAARNLAAAIGDGIEKLGRFLSSGRFREFLLFFTEQATKNIPKVVQGVIDLFNIFLEVAKAATPIFNRLLDKFTSAIGGARGLVSQRGEVRRPEEGMVGQVATINESKLDKFFGQAEKHLDAWVKLGVAIGKVFFALTGSAAAASGQTLVERITGAINDLADFINNNPEKVQKFFDDIVESVTNLGKILGRLGTALLKAFTSEEFSALVQVVAEVLVPGLVGFLAVLGKLAQALLFLLDIPVVGDIIKWVAIVLIIEKSFNKLFPVTQKLTNLLKAGLLATFGALRTALKNMSLQPLIRMFDTLRLKIMYAVDALKRFIIQIGIAAKAVGGAILGGIKNLARMVSVVLVNAIRLLRANIRLLLLASGFGALIVAATLLIEHWDKVKAAAQRLGRWLIDKFRPVIDWFRENWKKLAIILLAPFLIGGAVVLGLLRFKDRIIAIFKNIGNAIKNAFGNAFKWIRQQFNSIIDFIKKQYDRLPGPVKTIIRGAGAVAGKAKGIAEGIFGAVGIKRASGGTVPGSGKGDTVPAMLTPGEWVLNKAQQAKLAAVMGMAVGQVKATIFGTNSTTAPGSSKAGKARNNMRGKRVQYYSDFNLVAQDDPDGVTVWFIELANGSFGQVTARDAAKIEKSNGTWIPGYVKRSAGGFKQNVQRVVTGGISGFSLGGIVSPAAVQRFAQGGIVQNPGFGGNSRGGNTINQNFQVKTQGETDWGYVMRLGAISAQESF